MPEELTDHELKILREVAGLLEPSGWGAWVGACLEHLRSQGYITKLFGGSFTPKGRAYLSEHPL